MHEYQGTAHLAAAERFVIVQDQRLQHKFAEIVVDLSICICRVTAWIYAGTIIPA